MRILFWPLMNVSGSGCSEPSALSDSLTAPARHPVGICFDYLREGINNGSARNKERQEQIPPLPGPGPRAVRFAAKARSPVSLRNDGLGLLYRYKAQVQLQSDFAKRTQSKHFRLPISD